MRKKIVFLFIFVMLFSSVFAEVSDKDFEIQLKNDQLNQDIALGYWIGLECIIQDACPSAFLVFDMDNNYIGGYLAKSTRWDFCSNVSSSTKAAAVSLPTGIVMGIAQMIGANELYVYLEEYKKPELYSMVLIDPSFDTEIIDTKVFVAKKNLEECLIRHALNYDEFMTIMAENGYTEEEILAEKDKNSLVIKALKYKNEQKKTNSQGIREEVVYMALCILAIVIIVIFLILKKILSGNLRQVVYSDSENGSPTKTSKKEVKNEKIK